MTILLPEPALVFLTMVVPVILASFFVKDKIARIQLALVLIAIFSLIYSLVLAFLENIFPPLFLLIATLISLLGAIILQVNKKKGSSL